MNIRSGLIASVVLAASLASAGTASAQTSLTCVVDGLMQTTASTYNITSNTGVCGGIVAGVPTVATDARFNSAGDRTGDPCTVGVLADADGNGTTISSASQGFTLSPLGYTIQAAGGSGEITFAGAWVGSGALRFARGGSSAGACTPTGGSLYSVQGGFTITSAAR